MVHISPRVYKCNFSGTSSINPYSTANCSNLDKFLLCMCKTLEYCGTEPCGQTVMALQGWSSGGQVRHITSPRLQSHLDQFNRAIWVCPLANRDTHQHGLLKNQIHSTKNEKIQSATKGIFQKFPMHFFPK